MYPYHPSILKAILFPEEPPKKLHESGRLLQLRDDMAKEVAACMELGMEERANAMNDAIGMLHAAVFDLAVSPLLEGE